MANDELRWLYDDNPNDSRYEEFVEDRERFGDHQEGYYSGFRWKATRFGGWCGYIYVGEENQERCIDLLTRECTYDSYGWVGFSFNNCTDYPSSLSNTATFKSFHVCSQLIRDSIDNIKKNF